jgi:hypothetical protein
MTYSPAFAANVFCTILFVYTDSLSEDDIVCLRGTIERDVRDRLGITFNPSGAVEPYEHPTVQTGLPPDIPRCSGPPGLQRSAAPPPRGEGRQ